MTIFSYHLIEISFLKGFMRMIKNPISKSIPGLIRAEYMSAMTLGAPLFSARRILVKEVAVFMQWEKESDLEHFLSTTQLGKQFSKAWHLRLAFMREWGSFTGFQIPETCAKLEHENDTVVAVTLAKMKPFAVPRFIRWGRPVEKLVRDHKGTSLSLASIHLPNTVSTFSIWKNQEEMTAMVHGHSKMERPKRHADAMQERNRKNFHFEFTTLRFKPLGEYGSWKGKSNYLSQFNDSSK